jgi:hypothetical protein
VPVPHNIIRCFSLCGRARPGFLTDYAGTFFRIFIDPHADCVLQWHSLIHTKVELFGEILQLFVGKEMVFQLKSDCI